MRWRSRILLALILYLGGFATGVYALAPVFDKAQAVDSALQKLNVGSKSEEIAMVVSSGINKYVSFAEEKIAQVSEVVRTKLAERRKTSEH